MTQISSALFSYYHILRPQVHSLEISFTNRNISFFLSLLLTDFLIQFFFATQSLSVDSISFPHLNFLIVSNARCIYCSNCKIEKFNNETLGSKTGKENRFLLCSRYQNPYKMGSEKRATPLWSIPDLVSLYFSYINIVKDAKMPPLLEKFCISAPKRCKELKFGLCIHLVSINHIHELAQLLLKNWQNYERLTKQILAILPDKGDKMLQHYGRQDGLWSLTLNLSKNKLKFK